ncbi:MAG: DUF3791 domain-containing protein [Paludibacteraceae bacterium]
MPPRSSEMSFFLSFCIEQYKQAHNLTGEQAMQVLDQYGVLNYLENNYGVIHTQGAQWILADIDEFIDHRKNESLSR